jgi:hypothetical protein
VTRHRASGAESDPPFSDKLESWLSSSGTKTIGDLTLVFETKSIAIAVMLLMVTSALPVPTGGITNVFEVITMILAFELIVGRRTIWLPARFLHWVRRPRPRRFPSSRGGSGGSSDSRGPGSPRRSTSGWCSPGSG